MPNFITEDQIEQAILIKLHRDYGYAVRNCFTVDADHLPDGSNRTDKREVILLDRLKAAAHQLNRHIPAATINAALSQLTDRYYAVSPIAANRRVDALIRDGIGVDYEDTNGKTQHDQVRVIDFNNPAQNDFLAVSQLWIKGNHTYRRPDVILYVNGLPLVFMELKNSNVKLKSAFDDNLTNYKQDIPQLFHANVFCLLSNGLETRIGSFTAAWAHFFNWLRPDDETEKIDRAAITAAGISIERALDGLCPPARLLDYVENFVLYHKETQKIIAQNHQFIGVNKAIELFQQRQQSAADDEAKGKLGVFWHTQGSGKSFSMIFYARKIFRKLTGNYSFVIITDREALDGQIYRNFLNTGTVTKHEAARPSDGEEMRKFLALNKRIVFTLIQKFHWPKGTPYPLLSARDDIIVIVDEAHRTQYETLAENMRAGLPNARFLAFTGTPLLGKARKTNAWFGGYVSEYNFAQSIDDGATVPLFYEKRVPEVLIQNEDLSAEFYAILEEEALDDSQQAKLEKRFGREIEIIVRDDRLETIATDIVYHFPRRGYLGKGLVVCVDKFTAVKMYDKVQRRCKESIKQLLGRITKTSNELEKARLKKLVDFMRTTEMAVVISEEHDEERFVEQGLDIGFHKKRMDTIDEHGHDIEWQFKDEEHPLRLVFVCAMWLTGFDAPTLSTLYLDKPMRDHTLMQTIASANRVTSYTINGISKTNGEIIDYYNVFRNMKQALADYAIGDQGTNDDLPVQEKAALFALLDDAIEQGLIYCRERGVDLASVLTSSDTFKNLAHFAEFADTLFQQDEWRKGFIVYENTISSLYEACKPEIFGTQSRPLVTVFQYLRGVIDSIIERTDVDSATLRIAALLDQSIVTDPASKRDPAPMTQEIRPEYRIVQHGRTWDLSKTDFDKLRTDFPQAQYKNIEIIDLRGFIEEKIAQLIQQNATRTDFAQRLQQIVERYNAGGSATENYYDELINLAKDLGTEAERHVREGLTEDELELFDLLKKENLTVEETQRVKLAARQLLHRLQQEQPRVLIQDWFRDAQSQERVKSTIEEVLDQNLPDSYDRVLFKNKCDTVFQLTYNYARQKQKWAA